MKKKLLIASLLSGGLITAALAQGHLQPNQFWGNSGGGAALPFGFTIDSLTSKASPTSSDLLVISDQAASGALKKAVLSSIAAATAVTSIDAGTGAFTTSNGITSTGSSIQLTAARRTLPTTQRFTSGTNATYTTPANVLWIEIKMVGPGGGGSGSSSTGGNGGNGSGSSSASSCWNTSGTACTTPVYAAGAGQGGTANGGNGGNGGTVSGSSTCNESVAGANGNGGNNNGPTTNPGTPGANSVYGGGGVATVNGAGNAGIANTGGGGSTGAASGQIIGGSGGAGAYCYAIINNPAGTYVYTIGTGGGAGTAGTGTVGGAGAAGGITVIEHYNS
jgi:hypothetical protein